MKAESCQDLSSDHSPVIITLSTNILYNKEPPALTSRYTNWEFFRTIIAEEINLNISLKNETDINEAVDVVLFKQQLGNQHLKQTTY